MSILGLRIVTSPRVSSPLCPGISVVESREVAGLGKRSKTLPTCVTLPEVNTCGRCDDNDDMCGESLLATLYMTAEKCILLASLAGFRGMTQHLLC